jgi:hypothetical protein
VGLPAMVHCRALNYLRVVRLDLLYKLCLTRSRNIEIIGTEEYKKKKKKYEFYCSSWNSLLVN